MNNTHCTVQPTQESPEVWIGKDFVPPERRDALRGSDVLIVPYEKFRDGLEPVFPAGTEEMVSFIRSSSNAPLKIEVCIDENLYREIGLYADIMHIATAVVSLAVLPVFLGVLSNYLHDRLKSRFNKVDVEIKIIVVEADRHYSVDYKGPASTFASTVNQSLPESKK